MKALSIEPGSARQVRRRSLYAPLLACALALGIAAPDQARATAGSDVVGVVVALGDLPAPIRAKLKEQSAGGFEEGADVSTIMVVQYTVQPGGYFGWHRHGGPVWVLITQGTLTLYDGDDPTCVGTDYGLGTALLDAGNHTHNAVNHGTEPVVVYATFMLPAGAPPRIDAPDPGFCAF